VRDKSQTYAKSKRRRASLLLQFQTLVMGARHGHVQKSHHSFFASAELIREPHRTSAHACVQLYKECAHVFKTMAGLRGEGVKSNGLLLWALHLLESQNDANCTHPTQLLLLCILHIDSPPVGWHWIMPTTMLAYKPLTRSFTRAHHGASGQAGCPWA